MEHFSRHYAEPLLFNGLLFHASLDLAEECKVRRHLSGRDVDMAPSASSA